MPPLPRQYAREDLNLGQNVRSSAADFGAFSAQGMADSGEGLLDAGERLRRDTVVKDMQDADAAAAEIELRYKRELTEKELNTSGEITGFHQDYIGRFQKDGDAALKLFKTGEGKQRFSERMRNLRENLDLSSYTLERTRFKEGRFIQAQQTAQTDIANLINDPSDSSFQKRVDAAYERDTYLESVGVSASARAQNLENDLKNIAQTQIEVVADRFGPETAIRRIKGGAYNKMLPADWLANKVTQLENQREKISVLAKDQMERDVDNIVANAYETAQDPKEIERLKGDVTALFGGDERGQLIVKKMDEGLERADITRDIVNRALDNPSPQRFEKVMNELRAYAEAPEIKGTKLTQAERKQLVYGSMNPDGTENKGIMGRLGELTQSMSEDPSAFFDNGRHYPLVEKTKKKAMTTGNVNDWRAYLDLKTSYMRDAGFAESQIHVLSSNETDAEVQAINHIMREKPGELGAYFNLKREQYGPDYFNIYFSQIAMGVKGNGLDARAVLVAQLPGRKYEGDFVEMLKVDKKDLAKITDTGQKQEVLMDRIRGNTELKSYFFSRSPSIDPSDRAFYQARVEEGVADYARWLIFTRQADNFKDAADLAIKRVIPQNYGDGGMTVPYEIPDDVPQEHRSQIRSNVSGLLSIYADRAASEPGFLELTSLLMPAGADKESRQALARDLAENRMFMVNAANDPHLLEIWVDLGDGQLWQLNKNGKPVVHHMNQLAAPLEHQYLMNEFQKGRTVSKAAAQADARKKYEAVTGGGVLTTNAPILATRK